MPEYDFVEKPFLEQLQALGWQAIDQGPGVPSDPAHSRRTSFREVVLPDVFRQSVRAINTLPNGHPWLTASQLDALYDEVTSLPGSLVEANKSLYDLIIKHTVDVNEITGEQYPVVKLIDFDRPEHNHFLAINQFRIDTPGRVKDFIIPDVVLFVNGLPLVVVEAKDANEHTANPLYEAFIQIQRYSDQREDTHAAGLSEGEPRFFHFNQFYILTSGANARFGTITANESHLYPWRDIYPTDYRNYVPPLSVEREQEVLIQGMLPPVTLLDIVRNYVLFMERGDERIKLICRYQQYRAVNKILARLRSGETADERSGIIWHTQGSGKSLTMAFAVRTMRRTQDLNDYKVIVVNDRRDLEKQIVDTLALTGESVTQISHSSQVAALSDTMSDLSAVMVHKFREFEEELPDYLEAELGEPEPDALPASEKRDTGRQFLYPRPQEQTQLEQQAEGAERYSVFETINASPKVLLMVDEAHRTQGGDLSTNLFDAFPNATRIAFTGTPLVADRYKIRGLLTKQRFGPYIDIYSLKHSVEDGATVRIYYEGKTVHTSVADQEAFERKFEDLCRPLTPPEVNALKQKYGTIGDVLEAEQRINAIAEDLVDHYIAKILPERFKAQVVASSKLAAVRYQRAIERALAKRLDDERARPDADEELLTYLAFLQARTVISSDNTNEDAIITQARKQAQRDDAVTNFKKAFDLAKPLTGIAFLVVCDRLLTGFDAPIEQVMYIDKKVRHHNLLQTIARVNRTALGKDGGHIVDYIGLTNHLTEAFQIYAEEAQEAAASLVSIEDELPILESRYRRLLQLLENQGIQEIEDFVEQRIDDPRHEYQVLIQIVRTMNDVKLRATFEVYLKSFLQSINVILPNRAANPYKIPSRRFGYILAQVREHYKDTSINVAGAGAKVRRLINEHLIDEGIDPTIPPVELTAPEFIEHVSRHTDPEAKASEMAHAIRKHATVHFNEDPVFYRRISEKLEAVIELYEANWQQLAIELERLRGEAVAGRENGNAGIVPPAEAPFFDRIVELAYNDGIPPEDLDRIAKVTHDVVDLLRRRIQIINFWQRPHDIEQLEGEVGRLFLFSQVPALYSDADRLAAEMTHLAKSRHGQLIGSS
jgi:type I restriction enzyme R subunit